MVCQNEQFAQCKHGNPTLPIVKEPLPRLRHILLFLKGIQISHIKAHTVGSVPLSCVLCGLRYLPFAKIYHHTVWSSTAVMACLMTSTEDRKPEEHNKQPPLRPNFI